MPALDVNQYSEDFMADIISKDPHQKEFHQTVREVLTSIAPYLINEPQLLKARVFHRMVEPERIIMFRVPWHDDQGNIHINRGYRIEMNSAIGPYKGGLRFHATVNLSILKFLAFEQVFKNSLTGLPLGGGKGGSDFDPKGKSEEEVMRFCQSFMTELQRHIGQYTDVPAGDIGVGGREIGYLFGQYKRIKNEFTGTLTGKGTDWGGSLIRPEATGYGAIYFIREMLKTRDDDLKGKNVVISGSGNAAQFTAEKAIELGAKVLTMSDSNGYIYDEAGIDVEKLEFIKELKNIQRGRIYEYASAYKAEYFNRQKPWSVPCDIALPCATENELDFNDAKTLLKHGCTCVAEISNMACTPEAILRFLQANILLGPSKAVNAGGVAVSGLEMSQNSMRIRWTKEEINARLVQIMKDIHETCSLFGMQKDGGINYFQGADIGGFAKVANAMIAQGLV